MRAQLTRAKDALSALLIPAVACAVLSAVAAAMITWLLVSNEVGDDYLKFEVVNGVEVSSLDWFAIVPGALGIATVILAFLM